jgi:sec-independent protein translocase protein TatB
MFGIGFQELVLLSLIGLVVLGPERLPRVANQIGGWLGQARRMTRVMKRQLEDEIDFEKELNIKPQSREPSTQPTGIPSEDDHYSEAHDKDDAPVEAADTQELENEDDLAVKTADRDDVEPPVDTVADVAEQSSDDKPIAKETS